ncbi:hypothetical protein ACWIG3_32600 [Streptomyces celluloflavus]|uniref:hypothetical protein n=1 Tax=Streptomyces TaxID=1883 RepID=UPI00069AC639|nr:MULTISPECIES: hypothetical protein [Streptomyces]MYU57139.1 hypothetical protein [Streptomyces sp. SID7805]
MSEYAAKDASDALARARELGSSVRGSGRWYVRYQVIFGCAAALCVLAIGLLHHPYGVALGTGFWVVVIAGLSVYSARQRVVGRGFALRHGGLIATWGVLNGAVLAGGVTWFPGVAAWWVPGAVAVALPGLVGGFLAARR